MKTKKLIALLFAILLGFSLSAQVKGKETRSPEEMAQRQTEKMKLELQLTDAQVAQVQQINLKYAMASEQMRKAGGTPEAMKEQRKTESHQKDAELKSVLTPEQYAKLEQIREERKAQKK